MAMVNVSLDTSSRQTVLSIDGVVVPARDYWVEKAVFDGEEFIRFGYTVETVDANGLKERRQFFLPSPEEVARDTFANIDERGFASKIVHDDEKAKADVIDYLQQGRKSE
jgi:hypothetical protein